MRKSQSNGGGYAAGAVFAASGAPPPAPAGLYGVINRTPDYYGGRPTPNGVDSNGNGYDSPRAVKGPTNGFVSQTNLPYANGYPTAKAVRSNIVTAVGSAATPPPPPPLAATVQHYYGSASTGVPSSSSTTPSDPAPPPAPTAVPKQYRSTTTTITTSPRDPSTTSMPSAQQPLSARSTPHLPHRTNTLPAGYGNGGAVSRNGGAGAAAATPAYRVEHLASFATSRQLREPVDAIQKLKQMEKNSAVYAQPLILKLAPDRVIVEEENGTLVEQFAMHLLADPTAHQSSDPADLYNNVLLFTVREDPARGPKGPPTEMHLFQCVHVSSEEAAEDLHHFIKGNYHRVRPGLHDSTVPPADAYHSPPSAGGYSGRRSEGPPSSRGNGYHYRNSGPVDDRDDASAASNSSEYFEVDVNTLNRCFDDIERFVARIQSAALAQRELDAQAQRLAHAAQAKRGGSKKAAAAAAAHHERGILQLRAQMPTPAEFYELFQKFKLCLNLLAKLRDRIHEPNAPQLLHFLFTPLGVSLDACHWGVGRNVAEQVVSPLLTRDACELLRRHLTPREHDVWIALGKTWRTPPEDWLGVLPAPYRPVFLDGFAPYGYPASHEVQRPPPQSQQPPIYGSGAAHRYNSAPAPIHRGVSAPVAPLYSSHLAPAGPQPIYGERSPQGAPIYGVRERSVDNLELERLNLEKERLEFERMKVLDKEQQLLEQERRLRETEARLDAERRLLHKEAEKQSMAGSDRPDFYRMDNSSVYMPQSPQMDRRMTGSVQVLSNGHVAHHSHGGPPPTSAVVPLGSAPRHVAASTAALSSNGGGNNVPPRRDYSSSAFDISRPVLDAGAAPPPAAVAAQLSPPIAVQDQSPRQRAFFDELTRRRCKIVQVTYDRVAQNPKELTVARGEYLEVLNDQKNWWECRNVHNRLGYVPHTILSVVAPDNVSDDSSSINEPPTSFASPAAAGNRHTNSGGHGAPVGGGGPPPSGAVTGSNIINDEATPDYVKQRQGRRGEFRYF